MAHSVAIKSSKKDIFTQQQFSEVVCYCAGGTGTNRDIHLSHFLYVE